MHFPIVPCCHRAYLQRFAFDVRTDGMQFANVVFVTAIDMMNVMHNRFALCGEAGNYQSGTATQVRRGNRSALEFANALDQCVMPLDQK